MTMIFYARKHSDNNTYILIFKHNDELSVIIQSNRHHLLFNSLIELLLWLHGNRQNKSFILKNSRRFYSKVNPSDIPLN